MPEAITDQILSILEKLKDGSPQCISDILYGVDKLPNTGSEEDQKVLLLEQQLIKLNWVTVIERGGTNQTKNGYYYFIISPEGRQRLDLKIQTTSKPNSVKCALSTKRDDSDLVSLGLKNCGLLGFIGSQPQDGTFDLQEFIHTFSRGIDYFYTMDTSKERFQNRDPKNKGILGYARKTKNFEYNQRFYRYFNNKHQHHLYLVNPKDRALNNADYRDESNDNPIYIRENQSKDSVPLYLYSNSPSEVSQYYDTSKDSSDGSNFSIESFLEDCKTDLESVINARNLDSSYFDINLHSPGKIIITLSQTRFSFNLTLHVNGHYFTIVQNPRQNDFEETDDFSWAEATNKFNAWLNDIEMEIKNGAIPDLTALPISESVNAILSRGIFCSYDFSIGDSHEIEPAMGIGKLSDEMVRIIKNLKPEPGNMTPRSVQMIMMPMNILIKLYQVFSRKCTTQSHQKL